MDELTRQSNRIGLFKDLRNKIQDEQGLQLEFIHEIIVTGVGVPPRVEITLRKVGIHPTSVVRLFKEKRRLYNANEELDVEEFIKKLFTDVWAIAPETTKEMLIGGFNYIGWDEDTMSATKDGVVKANVKMFLDKAIVNLNRKSDKPVLCTFNIIFLSGPPSVWINDIDTLDPGKGYCKLMFYYLCSYMVCLESRRPFDGITIEEENCVENFIDGKIRDGSLLLSGKRIGLIISTHIDNRKAACFCYLRCIQNMGYKIYYFVSGSIPINFTPGDGIRYDPLIHNRILNPNMGESVKASDNTEQCSCNPSEGCPVVMGARGDQSGIGKGCHPLVELDTDISEFCHQDKFYENMAFMFDDSEIIDPYSASATEPQQVVPEAPGAGFKLFKPVDLKGGPSILDAFGGKKKTKTKRKKTRKKQGKKTRKKTRKKARKKTRKTKHNSKKRKNYKLI